MAGLSARKGDGMKSAILGLDSEFDSLSNALLQKLIGLRKIEETTQNEFFRQREQLDSIRSSWTTVFDTQKPSQVMLNKPRNMVRKVIR